MCVVKGHGHVWPSKFKGQGYGQGQTHWSHLRHGIQSICLLFILWQSDHFWLRYRKFHIWPWKFKVKVTAKVKPDGQIWGLGVVQSIVSWQSDQFWLGYSKFYIWPWKFKVKVMAKVKPDGHIWGLGVQLICLLFVSWQSNHFLTLRNLGQGHDENPPKSNQVSYRSGPTIVPKMKEMQKVVQQLSCEQESAAGGGGDCGGEPVQKR